MVLFYLHVLNPTSLLKGGGGLDLTNMSERHVHISRVSCTGPTARSARAKVNQRQSVAPEWRPSKGSSSRSVVARSSAWASAKTVAQRQQRPAAECEAVVASGSSVRPSARPKPAAKAAVKATAKATSKDVQPVSLNLSNYD